MKHVDEYREPRRVRECIKRIEGQLTKHWTIMEICGGQTHSIVKYGIDRLLPDEIELVHGPGCPVCVTPAGMIDKAIELAQTPDVIVASFGDMARVPGTSCSLLTAKARGGDVRLVYSPLDAVEIARNNPHKQIVFFAVGFETTAPTTAMAVKLACMEGVSNFYLLVSHVLVPPAMAAILSAPACRIQGFLAAGHVCTITGYEQYEQIARRFNIPIVVTGFEPLDILLGLERCVTLLENNAVSVENQYSRVVTIEGNRTARDLLSDVFQVVPRQWRGVGFIENSGYALSTDYAQFDAQIRFGQIVEEYDADNGCISGQVLQGVAKPVHCPHFGKRCTPEHPLGAPMVSSEGACAAYYTYRSISPTDTMESDLVSQSNCRSVEVL